MYEPSRLELAPEEMRTLGYRVVDLLVDHFANIRNVNIGAKVRPEKIRPLLEQPPSEEPSDPHELLDFLEREILPNNMRVDHPRYFAFVPGPSNFVSVMADAIASGFNVYNGTWLGGSAAVAVELAVIGWMKAWCGLPEAGGGLLVSGGSAANLTALVAARHAMVEGSLDPAVAYFSDQTHSAVERALRVIGLRPIQMRRLESDVQFRLRMEALEEAVRRDRAAGLRPFCVIANAGTTNTGAVDPLERLADFCGREGLWLHADGAYGAAAAICERGREALHGLGRVDSLALDPHKWLFQPLECGCVLLRDAQKLEAAFRVVPEYLRYVHQDEEEFQPCDYGIQLSRGFRALKIWLSVKTFGLNAFRQAVAHGFDLAELAERELRRMPGCTIVSPAQMGVVCFRFADGEAAQTRVVDGMLRDGYAFLTSTRLHGEACLRLCTIHPRTTEEDIHETVLRIAKL